MTAENSYTSRGVINDPAQLPPLTQVTRPNLTTKEVAFYTNMAEQTWREYACYDKGPIRPLRICGRLHWPTEAVRKLLGVA